MLSAPTLGSRLTNLIMPPSRTHNNNRALVCLVCFQKGASMCNIVGVTHNRIIKYFMEDFDPTDLKLPNGICGHCRNILAKLEKGEPATLNDPIDFSKLTFPVLTRRYESVCDLGDLRDCPCSICIIARKNPGQINHEFGGKKKQRPFKLGRPPVENFNTLPSPKPIKICKRCRIVIRKGISHPQPCGLVERRASLENIYKDDLKGLEIAASTLIKQKVANSPGETSTIQLATRGKQMTISKPDTSSRTKRALFQDEPISASELGKLKTDCKLSQQQTKQIAKFYRSWKGRNSFESGALDKLKEDDRALEHYFTSTVVLMDSSNKSERMDETKVERVLVYCHNFSGLIDHICKQRGFVSGDKYFIKIGIDGGGSFLKVCINIEKFDESSKDDKQNKKWSYAAGACSKDFKDSGVRKLMIIGIIEDAQESYDNLKVILDLIDFEALENDCCYNSYAFDMKVANVFLGLGTATSTYPCPWCEVPKDKFTTFTRSSMEMKLRDLKSIRDHALEYQSAVSEKQRKKKLSSADFYSCEKIPLVPGNTDDSTLVLDLVPPMELHLMLGIVNGLYDHLDKQLKENQCAVSVSEWSTGLGLKRSKHHSGEFNGNQCKTLLANTKTLLDNTKSLKNILQDAGAYTIGEPVLLALEQFNNVVKSCFGRELKEDYLVHIENFADSYLALGKNVTPKVHAVFVHVPQFLKRHRDLQKGMGYWSEQASESVHSDFDSLWLGSSYKRSIFHKNYNSQLLKCVVAYNSRHQ